MNKSLKQVLLGLSLPLLILLDASPDGPIGGLGLVRDANAVFGMPLTPISAAGVARRTTRRAVAVGTTAAATSAAAETGNSEQQEATESATGAAQTAPETAQPAGTPPVGAIVKTLPSGCESTPADGIQYYTCEGTRYRPAFQGNDLVYVVQ